MSTCCLNSELFSGEYLNSDHRVMCRGPQARAFHSLNTLLASDWRRGHNLGLSLVTGLRLWLRQTWGRGGSPDGFSQHQAPAPTGQTSVTGNSLFLLIESLNQNICMDFNPDHLDIPNLHGHYNNIHNSCSLVADQDNPITDEC